MIGMIALPCSIPPPHTPSIHQVGGRCQSIHMTAPLPGPRCQPPSSPSSEPGEAIGVSEGIFRFDTGPSLLLFPETYRETYRSLGQDMAQHVEVRGGLMQLLTAQVNRCA